MIKKAVQQIMIEYDDFIPTVIIEILQLVPFHFSQVIYTHVR